MYVNPFWFGVLCTILAEIVLVLFFAVKAGTKEDRSENRKENNDGK